MVYYIPTDNLRKNVIIDKFGLLFKELSNCNTIFTLQFCKYSSIL